MILTPMSEGTLKIARATYSIEEPWDVPDACRRAPLVRSSDGSAPRSATTIAGYFDDELLTFVFEGADSDIVATHLDHDAPIYEEDVVEAFLSPGVATEYFEIEVSPLGTIFDARVSSPSGVRSSMAVDRSWNCTGVFAAVRRAEGRIAVVLRVPFASLEVATPAAGEVWKANFFRIDRSKTAGDEFMAWRPTMKTPPDFHVVAAFGRLEFGG